MFPVSELYGLCVSAKIGFRNSASNHVSSSLPSSITLKTVAYSTPYGAATERSIRLTQRYSTLLARLRWTLGALLSSANIGNLRREYRRFMNCPTQRVYKLTRCISAKHVQMLIHAFLRRVLTNTEPSYQSLSTVNKYRWTGKMHGKIIVGHFNVEYPSGGYCETVT